MSVELSISEHHAGMLEDLRDEHGSDIDEFLQARVEAEIHESYQDLREAQ